MLHITISTSFGDVGVNVSAVEVVCLDACGVCGGDKSTCNDCADVINGTSVHDACYVCGGDNPTFKDCADVMNGTSVHDA